MGMGCALSVTPVSAQSVYEPLRHQVFLDAAFGMGYAFAGSRNVTSGISLRSMHEPGVTSSVGIKYFWSKSWGIGTRIDFGEGSDNYFRNDWTGKETDSFGSAFFNLNMRLIYRKDFGRFSFQPSLGIGVGTFQFDDGFLELYRKQPGTNTTDRISFYGTYDDDGGFSINPSVYLSWKFWHRIHLFAECTYIMNLYRTNGMNYHAVDAYTGIEKGHRSHDIGNRSYHLLVPKFGLTFMLRSNRK
jgi:hypothetical protein